MLISSQLGPVTHFLYIWLQSRYFDCFSLFNRIDLLLILIQVEFCYINQKRYFLWVHLLVPFRFLNHLFSHHFSAVSIHLRLLLLLEMSCDLNSHCLTTFEVDIDKWVLKCTSFVQICNLKFFRPSAHSFSQAITKCRILIKSGSIHIKNVWIVCIFSIGYT